MDFASSFEKAKNFFGGFGLGSSVSFLEFFLELRNCGFRFGICNHVRATSRLEEIFMHTHVDSMKPHDLKRGTVWGISLGATAVETVDAVVFGFLGRICSRSRLLRRQWYPVLRRGRVASARAPWVYRLDGGSKIGLFRFLISGVGRLSRSLILAGGRLW